MNETACAANETGLSGFSPKVLLATDGSRAAGLAARAAPDIQVKTGAELHLVHVYRGFRFWPGLASSAYTEQTVEKYTCLYRQEAPTADEGRGL